MHILQYTYLRCYSIPMDIFCDVSYKVLQIGQPPKFLLMNALVCIMYNLPFNIK